MTGPVLNIHPIPGVPQRLESVCDRQSRLCTPIESTSVGVVVQHKECVSLCFRYAPKASVVVVADTPAREAHRSLQWVPA